MTVADMEPGSLVVKDDSGHVMEVVLTSDKVETVTTAGDLNIVRLIKTEESKEDIDKDVFKIEIIDHHEIHDIQDNKNSKSNSRLKRFICVECGAGFVSGKELL